MAENNRTSHPDSDKPSTPLYSHITSKKHNYQQGHFYVVKKAGNTNLDGITKWDKHDVVISNGHRWIQRNFNNGIDYIVDIKPKAYDIYPKNPIISLNETHHKMTFMENSMAFLKEGLDFLKEFRWQLLLVVILFIVAKYLGQSCQ